MYESVCDLAVLTVYSILSKLKNLYTLKINLQHPISAQCVFNIEILQGAEAKYGIIF